jgi:precorrin-6Y C5,15-methyltransferase (decarboxylating)
MDTERLVAGNLFEIAADQFGSLCCMLVLHKPRHELNGPRFGLGEGDICHSRGLITKSEVRAAAIHALGLIPNSILWDVGAGSGSVGLEAARMVPDMLVYAIEKNGEQHRNILNNKSIFDVLNLKLIRGEAPEMLRSLPRPHRIFIGGSGGNLSEIIKVCAAALLPQGRIVVTGVLEKTCKETPALVHGCGFTVNTHRLDVRRNTYPETEEKVFNPITIVVGQKDD